MKRHCDLCDHQKLSLEKGDLCGLTNKKPNFNRTCTKIDFGNNLLDLLEGILIDLEDLKISKKKVYKSFISGIIMGVVLLICGYFLFIFFLNFGFTVSEINFDIGSLKSIAGLIAIPSLVLIPAYYFVKKAIDSLNNHRNDFIFTENNKNEIDEILHLYNQKYIYQIDFDKEVHGIQEVDVEIELL